MSARPLLGSQSPGGLKFLRPMYSRRVLLGPSPTSPSFISLGSMSGGQNLRIRFPTHRSTTVRTSRASSHSPSRYFLTLNNTHQHKRSWKVKHLPTRLFEVFDWKSSDSPFAVEQRQVELVFVDSLHAGTNPKLVKVVKLCTSAQKPRANWTANVLERPRKCHVPSEANKVRVFIKEASGVGIVAYGHGGAVPVKPDRTWEKCPRPWQIRQRSARAQGFFVCYLI